MLRDVRRVDPVSEAPVAAAAAAAEPRRALPATALEMHVGDVAAVLGGRGRLGLGGEQRAQKDAVERRRVHRSDGDAVKRVRDVLHQPERLLLRVV